MRSRIPAWLVVAALLAPAHEGRAQGAAPADPLLGAWTVWIGAPGDPGDRAATWCLLEVRGRTASTLEVVASQPGARLHCAAARAHPTGFVSFVLERRLEGSSRRETWELVGALQPGPVPRLRGRARITVLEEGRGREWQARFVAGRGDLDDPPDPGGEAPDPELGGGWTARGPKHTRSDAGPEPNWPATAAAPVDPAALDSATRALAAAPPAQAPPAAAGRWLTAAAILLLAVVWLLRGEPGPARPVTAPEAYAPGPDEDELAAREHLAELRAAVEALRAERLAQVGGARHVRFESRRLLARPGSISDRAPLPAPPVERTVPLAEAFAPAPAPSEGTVPLDRAFAPGEEAAPAERTVPLEQAFPEGPEAP